MITLILAVQLHIESNRPNIDKEKSFKIAKNISIYSQKHQVDPFLFSAILMQESSYRMISTKNDLGIAQVNRTTAKLYGFNVEKLSSNLEYSIASGIKILSDFKQMYGKKEKHWWTRYNSPTPKNREKYKKLVDRWR